MSKTTLLKIYFVILIFIPSISWSDIILDCKPTDPENGANKLIYSLNLERETLFLEKVFVTDVGEVEIIDNYLIKIFDISGGIIYLHGDQPVHGRTEWRLDTNSLELTNYTFNPSYPYKCKASEKIQLTSQPNTKNAIKVCEDIGFKKGTDKFMNCVLELSE